MVRIGIVGVGFMGMIHYLAARKVKCGRFAAICSRDAQKRAGDWRSIKGNFGPRGQVMDLARVKTFDRLEGLLEDPDIDVVDICNPTHLHEATAVAALEAGKHVLVEKPIALEPPEADAMLQAAKAAGKWLMVAHVLPFFPEFAHAAEVIRSGRHGRLLAAHFKRIISRPGWSTEIADPAQTGGPAIDLHIHDNHFIGLIAGMPERVFSTGVVENDCVQYLTTQYLYPRGGPSISCSSGALAQKGRPFVHGFEIYLERATILFESGTTPLTILTGNGKKRQPKLKGTEDPIRAFTAEIQEAVNAIQDGREPLLLSGRLARDALVLCHKEIQSIRSGKPVSVR